MKKAICWFRSDLRLGDNPALQKAVISGEVLPIYILDDVNSGEYFMGSASRWWLHHSLCALNQSLDGNLLVYKGDPAEILPEIIKKYLINAIYWNRCYEPWQIKRDASIKQMLKQRNIEVETYNGSLLFEPWEVLKQDKTPYKVFTHYYQKGCLRGIKEPRRVVSKPGKISFVKHEDSTNINDLQLMAQMSWSSKLVQHWHIGEQAAHARFKAFLEGGLDGYKEGRNFPARQNISRLSPYLHFGEISPHYIWYKLQLMRGLTHNADIDAFCSELGWREFSYYLLYHFPELPKKNWNSKFDTFPWREDLPLLKAWQSGQTGIPIVDAAMRELWQTGYMHNRVRMIVASFLVKNLLLDWRCGAQWFWDCLVDADLANNSASWQWVAGCGADAAPYFRIFNPVAQGQKFDTSGEYTKEFVPELKNLPDKYLFNPWEAPEDVLKKAGVVLGQNYPTPIIDLKLSRKRALETFAGLS
jgi:deoxyribodipyrimidine photo-lyase